MKKKKGNLNKNLIIFSAIVVAVAGAILYFRGGQNITSVPSKTQEQTKTYSSKALKFSINVPSGFQIEEKFTTILLTKDSGNILINRNGTNFENAEDYLSDLSKKNKIMIQDKRKMMVNGLDGIRTMIKYPGGPQDGEKIYYLYNNYVVYSLSTSSPALFGDLDKIAQSFRYTP